MEVQDAVIGLYLLFFAISITIGIWGIGKIERNFSTLRKEVGFKNFFTCCNRGFNENLHEFQATVALTVLVLAGGLAVTSKIDLYILFAGFSALAGTYLSKGVNVALDFAKSKSEQKKQRTKPQDDEFANDETMAGASGFDAGRFGAKPPPPPPQPDENAPRGYDKRHPDDAKLWAIVDDPDASDGERRNAMDMILKRQARRRGGNGGGAGRQVTTRP